MIDLGWVRCGATAEWVDRKDILFDLARYVGWLGLYASYVGLVCKGDVTSIPTLILASGSRAAGLNLKP